MGEVITVSYISVYTLGLVALFCFLWGSFIFYKKAVEAHFESEMVLDIVVLSSFWGFIFGRLGFVLTHLDIFIKHWTRIFLLVDFPGVERWGIMIGLVAGLLFMVHKKKGKYFDFLDLAMLGYLSGLSFFWVGINLISFYWQNIVIAGGYLLSFLLFWKLEKTYRFISWYRGSKTFARSGFVTGFGLFAISLIFLLERLIYRQLDVTSGLISLTLFVGGLALVYIRSGRILADDIKTLNIWNKKIRK